MIERRFVIRHPAGLHLHPASALVSCLGAFACEAVVCCGGGAYNAKSVINLLSAGIVSGSVIHLILDGPDEDAALAAATALLDAPLGG